MNNRIRTLRAQSLAKLKNHAKVLAAFFIGGALLIEGVELSARGGIFLFAILPASLGVKAAIIGAFCFLGYTGVLIALVALGPLFVRLSMNTHPYLPGIEIIRADSTSRRFAHNAVMTGVSFLGGFLRPTIFVSETVIEKCSEAERTAIFAHERAHLARAHLLKRAGLASVVFIGEMILLVAALVVLVQLGFKGAATNFGYVAGFLPVIGAMVALRIQRDRQELEADRVAIQQFGADPRALLSALELLGALNESRPQRIVGKRIDILRKWVETGVIPSGTNRSAPVLAKAA